MCLPSVVLLPFVTNQVRSSGLECVDRLHVSLPVAFVALMAVCVLNEG
jgi:hypothetical protein